MSVPDLRSGRFHYVGLGGSGMSALAQFQVMLGGQVSGSDRAFDQGERGAWRERLEALDITIHPQDGSGLSDDCRAIVVSTAVEDHIPDVRAARDRGLPVLHRSELLAHHVASFRTIAVSGTSGKSTVVAMVFEILRAAGRAPSVITGGELVSLQDDGHWGNAWYGGSDLLVVEADESDGSLTRYHPQIGVVTNLQRDHMEMGEALAAFKTFHHQTRGAFIVGEDAALAEMASAATVFGFGGGADVRATDVAVSATGSTFEVEGERFELPVPGRYNVENALAAISTCLAAGVDLASMVSPLADFRGVARRFQTIGEARGIEVVDDFAHNPNKIAAVLEAAQRRAKRVLAVYQPHGYGPTRFHRAALVATFAETLRPDDQLWMLEVYYAGGTTTRDISAADIVADIAAREVQATFTSSRDRLIDAIGRQARPGDLVLVMGARDPSLTDLARDILRTISAAASRPSGATM